jgi:hypothetical protein
MTADQCANCKTGIYTDPGLLCTNPLGETKGICPVHAPRTQEPETKKCPKCGKEAKLTNTHRFPYELIWRCYHCGWRKPAPEMEALNNE